MGGAARSIRAAPTIARKFDTARHPLTGKANWITMAEYILILMPLQAAPCPLLSQTFSRPKTRAKRQKTATKTEWPQSSSVASRGEREGRSGASR